MGEDKIYGAIFWIRFKTYLIPNMMLMEVRKDSFIAMMDRRR